MVEDKSWKPNGFKIRSWGDIAALAAVVTPLLVVAIACILWGLKLEGELNVERQRNNVLERRVAANERQLSKGILSLAESEISNIREDDREIKRRLERLESNR
jgi:hypothetical protein